MFKEEEKVIGRFKVKMAMSFWIAVSAITKEGVILYTPDFFKSFSEDDQEAIVAHELGHLNLGHTNKNLRFALLRRNLCQLVGLVQKEELEADQWAAEQVGKDRMIGMLGNTKEYIKRVYEGKVSPFYMMCCLREIDGRIEALK